MKQLLIVMGMTICGMSGKRIVLETLLIQMIGNMIMHIKESFRL